MIEGEANVPPGEPKWEGSGLRETNARGGGDSGGMDLPFWLEIRFQGGEGGLFVRNLL